MTTAERIETMGLNLQHLQSLDAQWLAEYVDVLFRFAEESRRDHYYCDGDPWFSCPKCSEGCADDNRGTDCTCGADEYNEKIDRLFARIASPGRTTLYRLGREAEMRRAQRLGDTH